MTRQLSAVTKNCGLWSALHNPRFCEFANIAPIAYQSNESGARPEVWVQSFPDLGRKRQVSAGGGILPRWKPNGAELFYVTPDYRMMSVTISPSGAAAFEKPVQLFQSLLLQSNQPYGVSADGRFLLSIGARDASTPIKVIVNWAAELGAAGR